MKILFVCAGNTCRSPMAAEIARREIRLNGYTDVDVDSAGLAVVLDAAEPNARTVASEHGCNLDEHRPTQLDAGMIDSADSVFVVDERLIDEVERIRDAGNAKTLGENISDPYGQDLPTYRNTWSQLERLIAPALTKLVEARERD